MYFVKPIPGAIKQIRRMQSISQKELADAAEVSKSYINHLEAERRGCSEDVARRIAAALKVPVNSLFLLYDLDNNPSTGRVINEEIAS